MTARGGKPKIHPCRAHAALRSRPFVPSPARSRSHGPPSLRPSALALSLSLLRSPPPLSSLLIHRPPHLPASRSIRHPRVHPPLLSLTFAFSPFPVARPFTLSHASHVRSHPRFPRAPYPACPCFSLVPPFRIRLFPRDVPLTHPPTPRFFLAQFFPLSPPSRILFPVHLFSPCLFFPIAPLCTSASP